MTTIKEAAAAFLAAERIAVTGVADGFHKLMRPVLTWTHKVPETV